MSNLFEETASLLARACVRREEINAEWDAVQEEITRCIYVLRHADRAVKMPTDVIPVPDHVRLRRQGEQERPVGEEPLIPCPSDCRVVTGHVHTEDGRPIPLTPW